MFFLKLSNVEYSKSREGKLGHFSYGGERNSN